MHNNQLLFQPVVEPVDYGIVPEDGICRFEDPVVFVGEVEQLAGDAETLEGVKRAQSLGIGDPEIQRCVDDEHRGFPALNEVYGIMLFIMFRIFPGSAEMVPFGEP